MSVTQMFCGLAPSVTRRLRQASAAAPAPEVTILTASSDLPLRRLAGVRRDRLAGSGHPRRIGEREVALVGERLRRRDLELSRARPAMIGERALAQLLRQVRHGAPPWARGQI